MTPTESTPEHIEGVLVVGGGYAGLHAASAAQQSGVPATVVDRTGRQSRAVEFVDGCVD